MTLDTVVERIADGGNLLANLGLLQDINTWKTSKEIWQAWQSGTPFEEVSTANMSVYRLVDGEAVFDLLCREGNPLVESRFREEAYKGIIKNEFFFPQGDMKDYILSAIRTGQSTTTKYSGLKIQKINCGTEECYIPSSEENTPEEKKLLSAVYGTDNPRGGSIYLLIGKVVKNQLQEKKDNFIVRTCFFHFNHSFRAHISRYISYPQDSAILGVRRKAAE